ncbi:MAG TPA: hypothetical protein VE591_02800 [Candidatus Acidoferrum sp.]|jgi:spermidine/putrescine-binding protein|nr:hypothetical protein [Candidatus Acidoferrum sp.]
MFKKLSLVALTSLVAGGGALAMTGAPAAAAGLSINIGVPGVYAYDDYRYRHDGGYRDDRRRDDHRGWRHDDRRR